MLKIREICALIRVCSAEGVAELQFGELSIRFGSPITEPNSYQATSAQAVTQATQDLTTAVEEEAIARDELAIKQERLERMMIEDPSGFEQLMISGELEDEPEPSEAE